MFRRLRSPLAPVLLAAVLGTTLLACGGDDNGAASSGGSVATTNPSDSGATDVSLVPASGPTASVPPVSPPAAAPTELKVTTLTEGAGTPAKEGDIVVVDYVGVRQA